MKCLFVLLACWVSLGALAQGTEPVAGRRPGHGRERESFTEEQRQQRHESMQVFREEMRRQQAKGVKPVPDESPLLLRRMSPEERQRMRQEMREAYRH